MGRRARAFAFSAVMVSAALCASESRGQPGREGATSHEADGMDFVATPGRLSRQVEGIDFAANPGRASFEVGSIDFVASPGRASREVVGIDFAASAGPARGKGPGSKSR